MGDDLKKIQFGDPLKIPVATSNAMIDAARDHQQRQRDRGRDARIRPFPLAATLTAILMPGPPFSAAFNWDFLDSLWPTTVVGLSNEFITDRRDRQAPFLLCE